MSETSIHVIADVYEVDGAGVPVTGLEETTEHRVRCVCVCGFIGEGEELEEAEAAQLAHQHEHDLGEVAYAGCAEESCEALRTTLLTLSMREEDITPAELRGVLVAAGVLVDEEEVAGLRAAYDAARDEDLDDTV